MFVIYRAPASIQDTYRTEQDSSDTRFTKPNHTHYYRLKHVNDNPIGIALLRFTGALLASSHRTANSLPKTEGATTDSRLLRNAPHHVCCHFDLSPMARGEGAYTAGRHILQIAGHTP